ncbi:MAG: GNAT family N-acetyltransferase [Leptospira sp.]|nr:GNAT family N-acetyltransferase [Leptospira sp.]
MTSPKLHIELTEDPTEEIQTYLWDKLHIYGMQKVKDSNLSSVSFFSLLVKEKEKIVAGALCYLFFKGLNLQLLWVDDSLRGKNIGTRLLQRVEEEAKVRSATLVFGYSFGFQAPKFYLKYGYKQVGLIEDYPEGHNCYFLCKRLDMN